MYWITVCQRLYQAALFFLSILYLFFSGRANRNPLVSFAYPCILCLVVGPRRTRWQQRWRWRSSKWRSAKWITSQIMHAALFLPYALKLVKMYSKMVIYLLENGSILLSYWQQNRTFHQIWVLSVCAYLFFLGFLLLFLLQCDELCYV